MNYLVYVIYCIIHIMYLIILFLISRIFFKVLFFCKFLIRYSNIYNIQYYRDREREYVYSMHF